MTSNPVRALIDLSNACWASRCLHTAVDLRLADLIDANPLTPDELGAACGADPHFIEAIVQVLSRKGVFSVEHGKVSHSDMSRVLRSDHPDSVIPIIDWMGSHEVWDSVGQMPQAARASVSAFELAHGQKMFDYLAQRPARFAVFSRQMDGFTRRDTAEIMNRIDFAPFATIADIGCGTGVLSTEIATRYPSSRVLAFDLPGVCPLAGRTDIQLVEGDFFVDSLPKAELTILCNILHDWSDAAAVQILESVRKSAPPGAHLFIIEGLVDSREEKVDLVGLGMAVMTGGRQRSSGEYEELLEAAGYGVSEVVKCTEYVSVMKAQLGA